MKQSLTAEVAEILSKVPIVKNLARKKLISKFILGLVKSRNVQFCQVVQHLNDEAKLASNEVRIQDFFREPYDSPLGWSYINGSYPGTERTGFPPF